MEVTAQFFLIVFLAVGAGGNGSPNPKPGRAAYQRKTVAEWAGDLKSQDVETRIKAASALANLGPDARSASGHLIEMLHEEKVADARVEAIWALISIAPRADGVITQMLKSAKDPDAHVRRWAIRGLAKNSTTELGLQFLLAVQDSLISGDCSFFCKQLIKNAAAEWQADRVVRGVIEALNDPSADVRLESIQALTRFGEMAMDAIPALRSRLMDKDEKNRKEIEKAILAIDHKEAAKLGIERPPQKPKAATPVNEHRP